MGKEVPLSAGEMSFSLDSSENFLPCQLIVHHTSHLYTGTQGTTTISGRLAVSCMWLLTGRTDREFFRREDYNSALPFDSTLLAHFFH